MTDRTGDLHGPEASRCYWSTVNAGEMLSGISTPMNWSWYGEHNEACMRQAFYALGALSRDELPVPADPDQRFTHIFSGRAAVNVDMFRQLADRTPGTSGDAVERQFFGSVRPGVQQEADRRRYPIVAVRFPVVASRIRLRLNCAVEQSRMWWTKSLRALENADPTGAFRVLDDAYATYPRVMTVHLTCSMVTQGFFDQLSHLTARAGRHGLEGMLTAGGPNGLEETAVLQQIWHAARQGNGDLSAVLGNHGFMGPAEISGRSWREDAEPLSMLVHHYRAIAESDGPAAVLARQRSERERAQAELLAALPGRYRLSAQATLSLTDRFMPTRETGRGLMLMPVDVGRAALRMIGAHLCRSGALDDPEDVFFLTLHELPRPGVRPVNDLFELVAARKELRKAYLTQDLPEAWQGAPPPTTRFETTERGTRVLAGIGVSDGVYEGTVCVVTDPTTADLSPGDVLVCAVTDPSWSALFAVAGALVVDIGGQFSHGAIIARELGLPCVVNTKTGTRTLTNGDRVRVNGHTGSVTEIT